MSDEMLSMFGYARTETALFEQAPLIHFLNDLTQFGYFLLPATDIDTEERVGRLSLQANQGLIDWSVVDAAAPPGISSALQAHLRDFLAGTAQHLTCRALPTRHTAYPGNFPISLYIDRNENHIDMSADEAYFSQEDHTWQNEAFAHWLGLIQRVAVRWDLLYGFAPDADMEHLTTREEALRHDLRVLYKLNLFGADIVASLGRERIMSAPAWRIMPLENSSILLIPTPFHDSHSQYDDAQVADYLGLMHVSLDMSSELQLLTNAAQQERERRRDANGPS